MQDHEPHPQALDKSPSSAVRYRKPRIEEVTENDQALSLWDGSRGSKGRKAAGRTTGPQEMVVQLMCSQNDDPTQHDLPKVDTPWAAKVHPDRLLRKVQGRQQAEAFEDMLRIDSKTLIDYAEGIYIEHGGSE